MHSQNNGNIALKKLEFVTLTTQVYILLLLPIQYKTVLIPLSNMTNLIFFLILRMPVNIKRYSADEVL